MNTDGNERKKKMKQKQQSSKRLSFRTLYDAWMPPQFNLNTLHSKYVAFFKVNIGFFTLIETEHTHDYGYVAFNQYTKNTTQTEVKWQQSLTNFMHWFGVMMIHVLPEHMLNQCLNSRGAHRVFCCCCCCCFK